MPVNLTKVPRSLAQGMLAVLISVILNILIVMLIILMVMLIKSYCYHTSRLSFAGSLRASSARGTLHGASKQARHEISLGLGVQEIRAWSLRLSGLEQFRAYRVSGGVQI